MLIVLTLFGNGGIAVDRLIAGQLRSTRPW